MSDASESSVFKPEPLPVQEGPETLSTRKGIQQLLNSQDLDGDMLVSVSGGKPTLAVYDIDFDDDGNTILSVQ